VDVGRTIGPRASGDHEPGGLQPRAGAAWLLDLDGVRVEEAGVAGEHLDVVAVVKPAPQLDLAVDDAARAGEELGEGWAAADHEVGEHGVFAQALEGADGLAQGL